MGQQDRGDTLLGDPSSRKPDMGFRWLPGQTASGSSSRHCWDPGCRLSGIGGALPPSQFLEVVERVLEVVERDWRCSLGGLA